MAFPSLQSWTFPLWIHVEAECRCGSVAITRNKKAQQSLYFTYEAQGWNWRQSYSIFNFVSWFFCLFPMKTFWHVHLGRSYRPVKAIFFSCFAKWEMSPIYLHLLSSTTASLFVCLFFHCHNCSLTTEKESRQKQSTNENHWIDDELSRVMLM